MLLFVLTLLLVAANAVSALHRVASAARVRTGWTPLAAADAIDVMLLLRWHRFDRLEAALRARQTLSLADALALVEPADSTRVRAHLAALGCV